MTMVTTNTPTGLLREHPMLQARCSRNVLPRGLAGVAGGLAYPRDKANSPLGIFRIAVLRELPLALVYGQMFATLAKHMSLPPLAKCRCTAMVQKDGNNVSRLQPVTAFVAYHTQIHQRRTR